MMDRVFNNSALEHIHELDPALQEISRVLKPGGEFSFNVLNHRYFEWWPLDETSKKSYQEWQPFHHAMSIHEWSDHLAKAGLKITAFQGYFDYRASQFFAKLDYWFSGYYIRKMPSLYVMSYLRLGSLMSSILKRQLEDLTWKTGPDDGAGYFIQVAKI
jgi:SAM-dependent methyltransferase